MPLSWNEIRNRAHEFSKRWEGESSERAEVGSNNSKAHFKPKKHPK